MEGEKGSYMKLKAGAFSAQLVYDILLTVSIIWILVQNRSLNSEVKLLKSEVKDLKIWQSLINISGERRKEDRSVDLVKKREILNDGSMKLADIIKQGIRGPPGPPGSPGAPGKDGRDGRDAVNLASVDTHIKTAVSRAVGIELKGVREMVKAVPIVAGVTYIRYGRTSCPSKSRLVYKGRLGGTDYNLNGGSSQYVCLPDNPEYGPAVKTTNRLSRISGTEFVISDTKIFKKDIFHQNAPCAICQTDGRTTKLMIPAKLRCPDSSWTLEYQGYLMSQDHQIATRTEYVCVDSQLETVPGMQGRIVGAELFHTSTNCPSLGHCPPYQDNRELVCVVCSK